MVLSCPCERKPQQETSKPRSDFSGASSSIASIRTKLLITCHTVIYTSLYKRQVKYQNDRNGEREYDITKSNQNFKGRNRRRKEKIKKLRPVGKKRK